MFNNASKGGALAKREKKAGGNLACWLIFAFTLKCRERESLGLSQFRFRKKAEKKKGDGKHSKQYQAN